MKRLIIYITLILLAIGCSTTKYIPIKETTHTHVIDSIAGHDTTIVSYITKERVVDIVIPPDTLFLETEYAKSSAWLDTSLCAIRGTLEQKPDIPIKTVIQGKERIIRDTLLTYKEVPKEVEVVKTKTPTGAGYTLGFCIIVVLFIAVKIYLKFI